MRKGNILPSRRAQAELSKLGSDIAIARKRRGFTQKRLAEGAAVSVETIRRLENGESGISIGTLAMVFLTLGVSDRLAGILDSAEDDVGLVISINKLPQRIREKKKYLGGSTLAGATDGSFSGEYEGF
jgi:transcriptional regulator with XRE-family HTH domain